MRKYLILFLFIAALFAKDTDMDGVPDSMDKCPNTPFFTLVNKYGCPIKKEKLHFLIYSGFERDFIEKKAYSSLFMGASIYTNEIFFGGYLSKYKTTKYKLNNKNIFIGIRNKKIKLKLKLYFPSFYNKKHYLSYYAQYKTFFNISFEHKVKKLDYNDILTISKNVFNSDKFSVSPYYYIYLNANKSFLGCYTSYYFNQTFSFSIDFSTGLNNNQKDYYISNIISFYF